MAIKTKSRIIYKFTLLVFSMFFSLVNAQFSIAGLKEKYQQLNRCTEENARYYMKDTVKNDDGLWITTSVNKDNVICLINNKIYMKMKGETPVFLGELNSLFYYENMNWLLDWRIEQDTLVAYYCEAYESSKDCDNPSQISRLDIGVYKYNSY